MSGAEDDRVDALYGLPLERFVPERDALAKALRAEGEREAADAVRKLVKPTRAAWALNTAVREHPGETRALSEAARVLSDVQRELLAGGDPAALREASERARAAIEALVAVAPESGGSTRDKVRATLNAALVDPAVLAEVTSGRLLREHEAAGFGGLDAPLPRRRAAGGSAGASGDGGRAARQGKLRRAKEEEAAAEHAVTAARRAYEQVESILAERRAQLKDAEKRLADARRRRQRIEG